jgi:hypothetical protein
LEIKTKYEVIFWAIVTIVGIIIAIMAAGGGDGSYIPLKVLFPYMMLSTVFTDTIALPFILLLFIQFPLYGLFISHSRKKSKEVFFLTILLLIIIHFSSVYFCFHYGSKYFR